MKDWVPLFQALVWPTFFVILIYVFRNSFSSIIEAIRMRIDAGADMELGPSGFTLSSAPVLDSDDNDEESIKLDKESDLQITSVYLVHDAKFFRKIPEGRDFEITVKLYSESSAVFERISKVQYCLHSSYHRRVRETSDRKSNFELVFYAWGQFNLIARVYFEGRQEPLVLSRFINF